MRLSTSAAGCANAPEPGEIVVSEQAWNEVAPELQCHFVAEGPIDLKGVRGARRRVPCVAGFTRLLVGPTR